MYKDAGRSNRSCLLHGQIVLPLSSNRLDFENMIVAHTSGFPGDGLHRLHLKVGGGFNLPACFYGTKEVCS